MFWLKVAREAFSSIETKTSNCTVCCCSTSHYCSWRWLHAEAYSHFRASSIDCLARINLCISLFRNNLLRHIETWCLITVLSVHELIEPIYWEESTTIFGGWLCLNVLYFPFGEIYPQRSKFDYIYSKVWVKEWTIRTRKLEILLL